MRTPINLPGLTAKVIYPASIFSLERHENIPYERFAYNVFREAISALGEKNLPLEFVVEFPFSTVSYPAWEVNCSVLAEKHSSGSLNKVIVQPPELLPTILFIFSACIGQHLFSDTGRDLCVKDPSLLNGYIQHFFDTASQLVSIYRTQGMASAIRTTYESIGVDFNAAKESFDYFDSLSFLIANHEVAHIYVSQLSLKFDNSKENSKAIEIIADLIASEWFFRRYVYFTPDMESYRESRKFTSHAEAVLANSKWAIETQLALLLLMGVSGAQGAGGRFHFEGGMCYPGSFGRYWLQQAWLFSAIEGELHEILPEEYRKHLTVIWKEYFNILCSSGVLSKRALQQVMDSDDVKIISQVADLVEANKIEELKPGIELLRSREKAAEVMRSQIKI